MIGWSKIRMLLHNSHHVWVHQPGRCCEASLQCVSPLYCFSGSAAPPVLVSLVHLAHHRRVLAFTVALIYTLSKCLWMQVTSHLQQPKTLFPTYMFETHISLCNLKMKCRAAISQTKESRLIKYDWECWRTSWCCGYFHKRASKEIKIRGITFWLLLVCWTLSTICDIFDIHKFWELSWEDANRVNSQNDVFIKDTYTVDSVRLTIGQNVT